MQGLQTTSNSKGGSFIDQSLSDTQVTTGTQSSANYANMMTEIKDRFPEFRTLNNNELELVLRLYEQHLQTPFQISNPAYYVAGALLVLVSMMFVNSQNLRMPNLQEVGMNQNQVEQYNLENPNNSYYSVNAPQKVIMITIVSSSTCGLVFVFTRNIFNAIAVGRNFGCYFTTNAMLSGAVAISAASNQIEVWEALIISLFGVIWYAIGSKILIRAEVDDP